MWKKVTNYIKYKIETDYKCDNSDNTLSKNTQKKSDVGDLKS